MRPVFPAAVLACLALGCASHTTIATEWRDPEHAGASFRDLLVISVDSDEAYRHFFEERFVAALGRAGVDAASGHAELPRAASLSPEAVAAALRGRAFEGVLLVRSLGSETTHRTVPARTTAVAGSSRGRYHGFYGTTYQVRHRPGHAETRTTVAVEIALYDFASAHRVWSVRSETLDPSSPLQLMDSVIDAVIERLQQHVLIR